MKISRLAMAAALALGTQAMLVATAADAQRIREGERQRARQQGEQPQGQIQELSREENAAIVPVVEAVREQDWAAASAALPAAQAAAQGPYARYVIGQLQFQIGTGTSDAALQAQGVDAMLESGAAPPDQLSPLLSNQIVFALRAENMAKAETALTRLLEAEPDNLERLRQLAEVKIHLNKRAEALTLYLQIMQRMEAAGQPIDQNFYRRALSLAHEAGQRDQALQLANALVRAHPSEENWRDVVLLFRETAREDAVLNMDVRRFMRVAGLLKVAGEYIELADAVSRAGLPGETKAVIEEGIRRGALNANDADAARLLAGANGRIQEDRASLPRLRTQAMAGASGRAARSTGDAYFGYGDYAEAAALYRAALEKGGEDANLVNLRLGMALALAGQRAEAQSAFRAVSGPRQELANFWLTWLESRGA